MIRMKTAARRKALRSPSIPLARQRSFETLEARQLFSAAPPTGLVDWNALSVDPETYDSSHILVRFRSDATDGSTTGLLSGTELGQAYDLIPGLYEVELGGTSIVDALAWYQASPSVLYAQPDYRVQVNVVANDWGYTGGYLWGLHNTGQNSGTVDADIDAPEAWDITTGSRSVIVAVIDSGVDYNHPDLASNIWTNTREIAGDGRDNDGNGYADDLHGFDFANGDGDPMDDNGHGTHVAGTIAAAGNNGVGMTGVSWGAQIMALKFLDAAGSGYLSNAVSALNYAVMMGAQISNNSWGGGPYEQVLHDAIQSAGAKGHLFVAAAGNENSNNNAVASYPGNFNLDNVISVAATDRNDRMASFSNWGATTVDLAAPGVMIASTTPGNTYSYMDGTSMATPHVSGVAALLWSSDPSLSTAEVKQRLLGGVDPIGHLSGNSTKPTLTNGRLNAFNSLRTDLNWTTLSGPATVDAGATFSLSRQYRVSGSAAGGFNAAYYLSADTTFGNADDVLLGTEILTGAGDGTVGIHSGVSPSFSVSTPGNYYVFARLDSSSQTTEFSESNNVSSVVALAVQGLPAISIGDVSINEGNSATVASFTVSLSAATSQTVTVNFATANGTAAAGSDYTAVSGSLSFAPGETVKTIAIPVAGDLQVEADETFYVNLSGPINAVIADNQATGTLRNDDVQPQPTDNLIASDSYGYQARPHAYENIDLVPGAAGVVTLIASGNDTTQGVNLGNSFNFYGTTYTSLYVSSNGLVTFGSANSTRNNTNLSSGLSQRSIAPLWDDWTSTSGNAMVLGKLEDTNFDGVSDRLILEWNKVQGRPNSPSNVTFQTILQLNTGSRPGDIVFNYPDLYSGNSRTNGGSATVGIKDTGSGGNRVLVSYNSGSNANVTSGKAIRISKPVSDTEPMRLSGRKAALSNGGSLHGASESLTLLPQSEGSSDHAADPLDAYGNDVGFGRRSSAAGHTASGVSSQSRDDVFASLEKTQRNYERFELAQIAPTTTERWLASIQRADEAIDDLFASFGSGATR